MSTPNIQNLTASEQDRQTDLLHQAILADNLEGAKLALAAGAWTDGLNLVKLSSRPPALVTAIFYNPINRLKAGATREWCRWMGIDPDAYARRPHSKLIDAPVPDEDFLHYSDPIATYPNIPMVELLMQHGANPNEHWGGETIFARVVNHKFLDSSFGYRDEEYQETLKTLVDLLLPSVREINLNVFDWPGPCSETIWNHVILHQIEQPALKNKTLRGLLTNGNNVDETLRQLITLKGIRWEHFEALPSCIDSLPSYRTLEFALEHIDPPNDEELQWSVALGKLLPRACSGKHWLYAVDLIRLGATIPGSKAIPVESLTTLISIYPKEHLNEAFMSRLDAELWYSFNDRLELIEQALHRGGPFIPSFQSLNIVSLRSQDFRYVLVLAQLSALPSTKVNWTAENAQTNPLYLFKKLDKDLQQYVINVGFMAPSWNKAAQQSRAPSREHAVKTFLKLKDKMPAIEEKIGVQRRKAVLFAPLIKRHRDMINNSVPYDFREGRYHQKRTRTGFYTLFHARRAMQLRYALNCSRSLEQSLEMINYQLSFYRGEKPVLGNPYSFWGNTPNFLTRKSKWRHFKSRIGYFGLLKKLQHETETAIRDSELKPRGMV